MDIFCKIVNGEIPAYKIYEDETVLCFLDINPDTNGHCLIIPKKHYLDVSDIDLETINHIFETTKKIKKLLEEKLHIDGLTLIQNNGVVEEVKHFHLHLKPFYIEKRGILPIEEVYKILKEDN